MAPDELFTRDEVLGGLPARRAATLLFLIETRTAHLADQSRRAMEFFLTEEAAKERDLAFLEAFSLGREPPLRPTIQDLERYAPQWAPLVPDNSQIRAALAHLLGQKYEFTHEAVPGIRAALGLDDETVQQAYRRLYREPLEMLFAARPTLIERLRWARTALAGWPDILPVFWTAFVLTVALGLQPALLALPIATAHVGPLNGILFLVVIGLINVLTMAAMAEACARSGPIRYGMAFVGRLVSEYLGNAGSSIFSLALAIRTFLALLAGAIGIAAAMVPLTHVPAGAWIALLILVQVYLLSRKSLKTTMTVQVLFAAISIALLLPIALVAFSHLKMENLLSGKLPFIGGAPFDPLILTLVFGVMLRLYNGHVYVVHCAKVMLPRDPSGRSLIRGTVVGTVALTALMALWALAIGGAIPPQALADQAGIAITPLAERVGVSVQVLGAILVLFFLGNFCIRAANVLFNVIYERLPTRLRSIMVLPRRRGSLLLHQRGTPSSSPRLGLTYLGLADGQPHFRLDVQWDGNTHREEIAVPDYWDATTLVDRLPELRPRGISLTLETLEASPEGVRLRVTSTMSLTYEGDWDTIGLGMADALTLPDPLRQLVTWMTRRGEVSLAEVTAHTGQNEGTARTMMDELVEQDFVQAMEAQDGPRYRLRLAPKRRREISPQIWQALDPEAVAPTEVGRVSHTRAYEVIRWAGQLMLGERGRFFLSLSPVVAAFVLGWWLTVNGAATFAWLISLAGLIINTLAAGTFPILLLIASRRKGDLVPGIVYRFLGNRLLVATIYVFFLANVFLHGLVIWQNPLTRASAMFVGLLIIGMTIVMVRREVFAPRIVVELREDQRQGGQGAFVVTAGGQPAPADVRLGYPEEEERHDAASGPLRMRSILRYATFYLPATSARELKVWAHRVTPEGGSEGVPALAEVHCGNETRRFDLKLSGGQVVLPLTSDNCWVRITLPEPSLS